MNILLCVNECAHAYFMCSSFLYFSHMEPLSVIILLCVKHLHGGFICLLFVFYWSDSLPRFIGGIRMYEHYRGCERSANAHFICLYFVYFVLCSLFLRLSTFDFRPADNHPGVCQSNCRAYFICSTESCLLFVNSD